MQYTRKVRPSVLGRSHAPSQGNAWIEQGSGSIKNFRLRPDHQKRRQMHIAIYNARILANDQEILELDEESNHIFETLWPQ